MDRQDRKAAIAAYKERKVGGGIFVVRCTATGAAWVGHAPDVDTIRNRIWFTLDHGSHPVRSLQAAWNEHGAAAFAFEVLHRIDPDDPGKGDAAAMRELAAAWREELGAAAI